MIKLFVLVLNLSTVVMDMSPLIRQRRHNPFADGIQPGPQLQKPRRVLSTDAHRKAEP